MPTVRPCPDGCARLPVLLMCRRVSPLTLCPDRPPAAPAEALTQACPPTTLPFGSGECLPFRYFCDGNKDCIDGSDETQCSVQSDQPAN